MKKIVIAFVVVSVLVLAGFLSAVQYKFNDMDGVSVSVKESEGSYRLYARYASYKTSRIHNYLRNQLHNDMFRKKKLDAYLTLEDDTRFHIKAKPGKLLIQLNKDENSFDSYFRIKQLGEGIKLRLTRD